MMADSSVPANYSGDHHSRNRSGSVGSVGSSGSGYIPGNESYGKKSGFFHNVKKALSGSKEKHPSGVVDVSGTPTNPELPGFSHGTFDNTEQPQRLSVHLTETDRTQLLTLQSPSTSFVVNRFPGSDSGHEQAEAAGVPVPHPPQRTPQQRRADHQDLHPAAAQHR